MKRCHGECAKKEILEDFFFGQEVYFTRQQPLSNEKCTAYGDKYVSSNVFSLYGCIFLRLAHYLLQTCIKNTSVGHKTLFLVCPGGKKCH